MDKGYAKNDWGNHFWANGYCVDTVGLDSEMIRKYVKYQEQNEPT
jgi:putative transposase